MLLFYFSQGLTNEAFVSDESESPEKKAKEEIDMSFVNVSFN